MSEGEHLMEYILHSRELIILYSHCALQLRHHYPNIMKVCLKWFQIQFTL